jgi:hypothetical protein
MTMRFMMLVKATADTEAGVMPSEEEFAAMGDYNEEMVNAGVVLDMDGLHPSSKGVRVTFDDGNPTVVDGPFTETSSPLSCANKRKGFASAPPTTGRQSAG